MGSHHMSAVDSAWLRMDQPGNLLVINSVMWTDEPLDLARYRSLIQERMVDRFPRFRQFARASGVPLGRAEWVDDEDFDLDWHVRPVILPEPADQAALQDYISSRTGIPLDPARPLWEAHFVANYGEGSAVFFRLHHAIADGISLMRVVLSLTDNGPDEAELFQPVRDAGNTEALVATAESLVGYGLGLVRHPSRITGLAGTAWRDGTRLLHLATLPPKPKSVLSGDVGPNKLVTWVSGIPLARVKAIGRATGTTVNDVLLTALSGALGSYLEERGTPLAKVRVMLPVNLRPLDRPLPAELGNDFGFYFADLPTAPMSPTQRLAIMHRNVEQIKGSPEALVSFGVLAGLGAMPKLVEDLGVAFFGSKAAGVVTNVPGPREAVTLAGARVSGMTAWVPRGGDMGFGVAIFSYADQVVVGFSTDAGLMPDPHRLQELVCEQLDALATLVDAAV